jgi:hypothetical protein
MAIKFLDEAEQKPSKIRFLDEQPVDLVSQIPTGGYPTVPLTQPTLSASERMQRNLLSGVAAVPALAIPARLLQTATAGTRAAPYTQAVASAFVPRSGADLARQTAISGGTAVGAGEIGQAVAEKAGEEYRLPAEIGAGLGLAFPANALLTSGEFAVKGLVNRAMGREFFDTGLQAAQTFGSAKAASRISDAIRSNPDLPADLARAKEIESLTGVKLPVPAASKGDTTIVGLLASETARAENAAFTAAMKQQEKAALDAVREAQKRLAGDPRNAALVAEVEARKIAYENSRLETVAVMKQANIQRQLGDIDNRMQQLTSDQLIVDTGKQDLGLRVKNLLDSREAVLRQEFKPLYEGVLKEASDAGVTMDSPVVATLWNFVKQRQADDVFAKFPQLDAKIKQLLAPKKAPVSSKFAEKYPNLVRSIEGTFKPLEVNNIDSLKRAINKAIGQTQDRDQLRMLYELKNRFDDSLQTLPEDFVQAYKGLDKQFAEKLGMPFSEAGVVAVDKARFVESTVPMLTNKPSAIRQILTATDNSPEAAKIVEDAFLMKISQTNGIVNPITGEVNPFALRSFINKNSEGIDLVPGLRQRLETTGSDAATLLGNRQRLLEEQKNAAVTKLENVWSKAYGQTGGFEGFVSRALTNPQDLNELIRLSASDSTLQRGLKAVVMDLGLNSTNKVKFFDDNVQTINTLFGKDHAQNVKALLEASDRLAKNPVMAKINQSLSQTTEFEKLTGSDPARLAALARNQVQGTFYKISTTLSRFLQNRSTKSESAEIQDFLSNYNNVKDATEAIKALEQQGNKGLAKAKAVGAKLLNNASTAALIGASAPLRIIERQEVPEMVINEEEMQ